MSAIIPCAPACCPTAVNTQVPGAQGLAGGNGLNGINAFSTVTNSFVIPAINSTVSVTVNNTSWMAVGQIVVASAGLFGGSGGPATFSVTTLTSSTVVVLTFLGYAGDVAAGGTITGGSTIAPAGVLSKLTTPLSVYGLGGSQSLTTSYVLLTLNATAIKQTLTSAGTYLLFGTVRFDYVAATFAANQTISVKLRRNNNTPGDVANAIANIETAVITTLSYSVGSIPIPPTVYTTTNTTDSLEMDATISVAPGAGSVQAIEASFIAVKLF